MATQKGPEAFNGVVDISGVAGYIIGRRGATVREMETQTGARIIIDDKTPGKENASISASTKAVLDDAMKKVREAVDAARSAPVRPAPAFTQQVPLTPDQAGAVIGKGGATIQDIRSRTGASIKVVSRSRQQFAMIEAADAKAGLMAENEVRRVIAAAAAMGPPDRSPRREDGRERERRDDGEREPRRERGERGPREERAPREARPTPAAGAPSKSLSLPDPTMTVVLVGPRGATVRALEDETGATIDVDRESGKVTVTGPTRDVVENACKRVMDTVANLRKCSSGAGCGGWAKDGDLFCPRCARQRETGEAADGAGFKTQADRRDRNRVRETGRNRARDTKEAGHGY